MDRILKTLGLRREKKLPKSLTRDSCDSDYQFRTNRSKTYDCKRLSASYTLLSETPEPYNRKHLSIGSMNGSDCVVMNSNCVDETDVKKINRKTYSINSKQKPPKSFKTRMFSKSIFGRNRVFKISPDGNTIENKPNMLWYGENNTDITEERPETDIKLRHSLATERENHQKEMAKTIADELTLRTRTQSLSLRNTESHYIVCENK